ncbi:MAG: hypothetical protein RR738_01085 [Anaerorhabdus sp.]|uniref:hypothetical protein n=1 Tax=Anaerorhabdus sp. TaxID=1872524 RepID=UPI002FCA74BE
MKKIVISLLATLMLLGSPIVSFAQENLPNNGYGHTHPENLELYADCYHTYINTPVGSEHDKTAPNGRVERVQTYTARCTKCGDYYYWDQHLYWYA